MKYIKFIILTSILLHCSGKMVEQMIAVKGSTLIKLDKAKLAVPEGCGLESTLVSFEQRAVPSRSFFGGYRMIGQAFVIKPDSLLFTQPIRFSYPVGSQANVKLAVRIAHGFVPLAGSGVVGETLQADINHGGEYYVIETPAAYGISNAGQTDSALLIVPDMYVGDYVNDFSQTLKSIDYDHPVWLFTYPPENSIEQNTRLLSEKLQELHERFGKFKLDVVGFGVGGLITHRYIADTAGLYHTDISPAIIAVGTPFFGSSLASRTDVMKSINPFRFYLLDGLGDNVADLQPGSPFVKWVKNHRSIPGWLNKSLEENKNFASIRGVMDPDGSYPEEYEGDGVVSLSSAMLTAIEPDPFRADHFELFENKKIQAMVGEFIKLYRGFNWPLLFSNVWKGEAPASLITETWVQEAMLNFRDKRNFDILLEWNKNMLASAPQDAILITNGDNDTYPAWYLQDKGTRADVMVVNWSLLNTADYIHFIKKNGLLDDLPTEKVDSLRPYWDKKTGEIVYISDYIIGLLLQQTERPVVFSTTLRDPQKYNKPLKLTGLVYSIGEDDADINTPHGDVSVDIIRTEKLFDNEFVFDKTFSVIPDSLSEQIRLLIQNYAAAAFQLSVALGILGRYDDALKRIEFAKRFSKPPMFFYNEALTYLKMDEKGKADSIFQEILNMQPTVEVRKSIARTYFESGYKEKAVVVLANYLAENPNDKEITELIKKYQEE